MLRSNTIANLYRLYYRSYYYSYARWVILNPKVTTKSKQIYHCKAQLSQTASKHGSFLFVTVPLVVGKPNPWFFYKRHFAYSHDGGQHWYKLPSMTPWSADEISGQIIIKYGLNRLFVAKHLWELERLVFGVWD